MLIPTEPTTTRLCQDCAYAFRANDLFRCAILKGHPVSPLQHACVNFFHAGAYHALPRTDAAP